MVMEDRVIERMGDKEKGVGVPSSLDRFAKLREGRKAVSAVPGVRLGQTERPVVLVEPDRLVVLDRELLERIGPEFLFGRHRLVSIRATKVRAKTMAFVKCVRWAPDALKNGR